jgi:hypothetical protein
MIKPLHNEKVEAHPFRKKDDIDAKARPIKDPPLGIGGPLLSSNLVYI